MYRFIFNRIKKIIPKISETEIIALKSGGTSLDRELFKGRMDYQKLFSPVIKHNIPPEIEVKMVDILKKRGSDAIYPSKDINDIMQDLGKNGFLSMIIDKKYGGNRLPIEVQSQILSKISSYNRY